MICCVRKANLAESSDGRERASSKLFVCNDCVPPSTADKAWIVVLTILLSGCSEVRVEPVSYTHLTLPTNREV